MEWEVADELVLEDDPETMREALAMIDALGSSSPLATIVSSPAPSPSPSSSPSLAVSSGSSASGAACTSIPSARTTKRSGRYRPKEQLEDLRAYAEALTRTLEVLRGSAHDKDERDSAASAWQQIAERQKQQRLAAEDENAQLRAAVLKYGDIGHGLSLCLQRIPRPEIARRLRERLVGSQRMAWARWNTESPFMTDAALLARVATLQYQSAVIFSAPPFSTDTPLSYRRIHVSPLNVQPGGARAIVTVNVTVSWVVPFALHRVEAAVWEATVRRTEGQIFNFQQNELKANKNEVMAAFTAAATLGMMNVELRGKRAACRFTGNGSTPLIVSSMYIDQIPSMLPSLDGVVAQEDGWIRMRNVGRDDGSLSGNCTPLVQVQCCRRVYIYKGIADRVTVGSRASSEELARYALPHLDFEFSYSQQMIDNLLLQPRVCT